MEIPTLRYFIAIAKAENYTTAAEIRKPDDVIVGSVYIGGGESASLRLIAQVVKDVQAKYPDILFHCYSGIAEDIKERLDETKKLVALYNYTGQPLKMLAQPILVASDLTSSFALRSLK